MAKEEIDDTGKETLLGGAASAEPTTGETPPPVSTDASSVAGGGRESSMAGGASAVAQTAAEEAISIREAAKQYGVDLSGYPDDASALQALITQTQQAQQLQQLAPYGQLYQQHAAEFSTWMAEKQQADAAKAAQKQQQDFWQAPEFDPRWKGMIQKNPVTNVWETVQGAPPEILPKFLKYADWLDQTQNKFWANPVEALKPGIQPLIENAIKQTIAQELGAYREQEYSQRYVQQNANWLFQNDGKGNFTRDINQRPVLTEEGQAFYRYLTEASSPAQQGGLGIQGIERQEAYARSMVQRDLALKAVNDSKSVSDEKKKQFLQQQTNALPASHSGSTAPSVPRRDGTTDNQNQRLTLAEMLRNDLKQAGVVDDDIRNGALAAV